MNSTTGPVKIGPSVEYYINHWLRFWSIKCQMVKQRVSFNVLFLSTTQRGEERNQRI